MAAIEKYHGWEIRRGTDKPNGAGKLVIQASKGPNDLIRTRTAEDDESLDYQTLINRTKVLIAEKEFHRASGEEKQSWETRLTKAVEVQMLENAERKARRLAGAPDVAGTVARLTSAHPGVRGGQTNG